MASDTNNSPASDYTTAKGGLYGGAFNSSSLPDTVRAVLMDYRWTTAPQGATAANTITYAFATSITDFTSVPGYPNGTPGDPQDRPLSGVAALNGFEKAAIITAFNLVKAYTGLNFIEVGTPTAAAASLELPILVFSFRPTSTEEADATVARVTRWSVVTGGAWGGWRTGRRSS